MEAKDIFGDEPDSDEISEAPTMDSLVNDGQTMLVEHKTILDHIPDSGDTATAPQRRWLSDLLVKKKMSAALSTELSQRLDPEVPEKPLSVPQASFFIDTLKDLPNSDTGYAFPKPSIEELPAGRYAVLKDGDEEEVRFYQVWRGTKYDKPDLIKVYLQHGPDDSELPFRSAMTICKLIVSQGTLECAQRYGREIGSCYRCGRRLTNRLSRQLGIGPVCGNRDFGDEFKNLEVIARNELTSQGYDPDETIEIDSNQ